MEACCGTRCQEVKQIQVVMLEQEEVFSKQKVGVDLEFNTIRTIHTTIDVDANTGNNTIDIKYFPSADVDNQNQKIINIATPTQTADAATKGYVDGAISGVSSTINQQVIQELMHTQLEVL